MTEEAITYGNDTAEPPAVNPFEKPEEPSIVDTILDLDAFLSGDVRLAEKTAYFFTRPDIEADLDDLEEKLAAITDETGRPLDGGAGDVSISDGQHPAVVLANQIEAMLGAYRQSRQGVRVRQMPSDEWIAFRRKHKQPLENADHPGRQGMWDELIVACAIRPKFTPEKLAAFRKMVGDPQIGEIEAAAFEVCTRSGVSVPKSPLSSLVLKQQERAKS